MDVFDRKALAAKRGITMVKERLPSLPQAERRGEVKTPVLRDRAS
jgi:hypothetical protein